MTITRSAAHTHPVSRTPDISPGAADRDRLADLLPRRSDLVGDVEYPRPELWRVLDSYPLAASERNEAVRWPDAGFFLDQDEVAADLRAVGIVNPAARFPFFGDVTLDDPVRPSCKAVAPGIQRPVVQLGRADLLPLDWPRGSRSLDVDDVIVHNAFVLCSRPRDCCLMSPRPSGA